MTGRPRLLVAPVRTLDRAAPTADWLVLAGGQVAEIGRGKPPAGDFEREVHTGVVAPAFVDPHLHLMAMAAARRSIDCSRATRVEDVLAELATAAGAGDGWSGPWLRAWGYDDAFLAEGRHPRRSELDAACGDRPVVLHHRTGHLAVLNSAAARALGVDPPDGVLVDGHAVLAGVPRADLGPALAEVGRELLAHGVVSVTDATHTNRPDDRALIDALTGIGPQVCLMNVDGPVKVMPVAGHLDRIGPAVAGAHRRGRSVAVHVDDIDVLEATLAAFEVSPGPGRIEHAALVLPEQIGRIAALGLAVVTQPAFLVERAPKYRAQLSDVEHDWLYRVRSLLDAGIDVRFSSDAPVVAADPLATIDAALVRDLGAAERVDADTAMRLHTGGPLRAGGPADLVVLSAWPAPGLRPRVEAVYLAGERVGGG